MKAKEFAEMCYAEKEIQLKEYMNGNESLVTKLKNISFTRKTFLLLPRNLN